MDSSQTDNPVLDIWIETKKTKQKDEIYFYRMMVRVIGGKPNRTYKISAFFPTSLQAGDGVQAGKSIPSAKANLRDITLDADGNYEGDLEWMTKERVASGMPFESSLDLLQ